MTRPRLARLDLDEDPAAWAALGFAGPVGGTELVLHGGDGGISGWALEPRVAVAIEGPASLDGLVTGAPPARASGGVANPNGAIAVDHVVVRTPDVGRTVAALQTAGLELRRTRPVGDDVVQAFLPLADALVEVVGPPQPAGDGPARF